ncbi:MAG: response regulator [Myxococcaceae bacterium]|jgi:DNA-binding NtrC family response regulator|nr:MAG: response regulator [Myxococcaceae bacterium]
MPRVLIIQDDPAVLALMRHGLVRRGYEVDSVRSAHEAMDRLKTERPDLVVSDVHLEDARGDLLLGAVEAHFPDVACLLVTSGPTSRSSFGGISVLRKPWDIVHFVERVCSELDKRAARNEADTRDGSLGRASVS